MKLLVLLCAVGSLVAMEIVPERHELEYVNHKYVKYMSVTYRKHSHKGPQYVNLELDINVGVGNNVTVKLMVYENLGGHYIPTPLLGEYRLCDFLYKEPFFGQMYAKQLPGNWTCPFPAGEYHFMNLTIHLEKFPYVIPFTYSSMIVRTRADFQGFITDTKEQIFRWTTYFKVTQKLQNTEPKKKKQ